MKIKYLFLGAVLLTAVLGFGVVAPASAQTTDCMSYSTTEAKITCLTSQMNALQPQVIQACAVTPVTTGCLMLQIQVLQIQLQIMQLQQSTPAWCHTFVKYLYVGVTDPEVTDLENALRKEGIYPANQETYDTFDDNLAAMVVTFQGKYGITQTGTVGPLTRTQLNSLYGCTTTCTPNWSCGSWSTCSNGLQLRSCYDSSNCGVATNEPPQSQSCTATTASVTWTNPASYTTFIQGQTYTITWTSSNILASTNMNIGIYTPGVGAPTPIATVPNTGSYIWTVSNSITIGNHSLDINGGGASAASANFTISSTSTQCTVDADCPQPNCGAFSANCVGSVNRCVSGQCVILTTPSITVTSPNGGENWKVGQQYNITWTTSGATEGYKISLIGFLKEGAVKYSAMVYPDVDPSSGVYAITVPSTLVSGNYKIGIDMVSPSKEIISEEFSDNYFTISPSTCPVIYCIQDTCPGRHLPDANDCVNCSTPCSTTPSITVTSPNGGETWQVGSAQTIKWTTNNIPSSNSMTVRLRDESGVEHYFYSGDYANAVPNNGFFSITVPTSLASGKYKAEVKTSVNGVSYMDASDNYFTISAVHPISVNSISVDASNNVRFTFSQIASSCLQIKDSQGNYFALTSSQFPYSCANSSLFTGYETDFTIPQSSFSKTIAVGQSYQVCNYDTRGNSYNICSNPILVTSSAPAPTITVTRPDINYYTSWQIGNTMTISWTSTGLSADATVSIGINGDGQTSTMTGAEIVRGVPASSGSYQWTIPLFLGENLAGKKYNVYVNAGSVGNVSNGYFTITAPSTTPSITVTSPNGGETLTMGQPITIRWTSNGLNSSNSHIGINLLVPNTNVPLIIADSLSGDATSYVWTPGVTPGPINPGTQYKIQIAAGGAIGGTVLNLSDTSDNYFTISSTTASTCTQCTDVNGSGMVTPTDSVYVINRIGACAGASNYDVRADIDADGCIGQDDADCVTNALGSTPVCKPCTKCVDIDGNGTITPTDSVYIINRIGACTGSANYDVKADIDADGCIEQDDATCVQLMLGKTTSCTVTFAPANQALIASLAEAINNIIRQLAGLK